MKVSLLQISPTDILSALLSNPFELSLVLLFISGYVFLALTGRRTTLWRQTTSSERILIAMAVAAGFELLMSFAPMLAIYFTLYHGAFDLMAVYYQSAAATIMFLAVLPLVLRADHVPEGIVRRIFSSGSYMVFIFSAVTFFVTLWLAVFSEFYSAEAKFFQVAYLTLAVIFWYFSSASTFGFHFIYKNLYYKQLHIYLIHKELSPRLASTRPVRWVRRFNNLSYLRKGMLIAAVSILIVVPVSAADNAFALFTPTVLHQVGPYHSRGFQDATNTIYLLDLKGDVSQLRTNHTVSCSITAYEPMTDNISIRVPLSWAFSLNNVTITNPSSISIAKQPLTYLPMLQSGQVWQNLFVNSSKHLGITPKPSAANAQLLYVGFGNASRHSGFVVNIVYARTATPTIDCTETVTYSPVTNGTRLITHQFRVDNKGADLAVIKVVDLRDVVFFGANSSSVSMTRNGAVFNAFTVSGFSGEVDPSFAEIPPLHQMDWTISFRGRQ